MNIMEGTQGKEQKRKIIKERPQERKHKRMNKKEGGKPQEHSRRLI